MSDAAAVQVKLFAVAKQAAGRESIELEVCDGATVADVRRALVEAVPQLAPVARHLLFAVDAEYAQDSTAVRAGQEIACIPPVSGG